jgi:beta-lactamase regulating signal transducer with metallopeptidase domain
MMENISQVIFYTLLHSLWQGLLLALLAGVIVMLTRKRPASLRYALLTGSLFLFAAAMVCTLILECNVNGSHRHQTPDPNIRHINSLTVIFIYIQQHAEIFVTVWLMLVLVKSCRLILGLYTLKRLNKVKTSSMPVFWEERFTALVETMKISASVTLLESGIVQVPLVIGYLKPVILVPIGLINSLAPDQVEAILLHELAHIVRKDYLVNLIQKIIGTLFFFNPAVLWVSFLIRSERENCCDDIAIGHTRNRFGYMRALISFEEYRQDLPDQALAITGNTGAIPQRIKRMISGKNRSLLKLEIVILSLMTFLFAAASMDNFQFSAIGSQSRQQQSRNHNPASFTPDLSCTGCPYMHDKPICSACGGNIQCQCVSIISLPAPDPRWPAAPSNVFPIPFSTY